MKKLFLVFVLLLNSSFLFSADIVNSRVKCWNQAGVEILNIIASNGIKHGNEADNIIKLSEVTAINSNQIVTNHVVYNATCISSEIR